MGGEGGVHVLMGACRSSGGEGGGEGGGGGDIGCPSSWGIPSSSSSHSEGVGDDAGEGEGVKHVSAELGGKGGAWLSAPAAGSGSGISISSTSV